VILAGGKITIDILSGSASVLVEDIHSLIGVFPL